ncbi:hypothetical protein BBO_05165 [Beauveria brongniartii RCEF 3172]|uniref:Uncharacterized protein n=1 Tax=Beauveria brongniartii RCEF 3172 TaxID=1081107 RepID=A0A167DKA2_9HYPO|nr:hypothetical protein BBO_05165 [Beauveria brongniartii RCEF 3172]
MHASASYRGNTSRKPGCLQRHERVTGAVDGPKVYRQPRAFTVWMQSRLRDSRPGGDSDSEDLFSILAPGHDAVNGFQDIEEDSIAEFDAPLMVDVSSGSEGSTDGEQNAVRYDDSNDDDGNVDKVDTGDGGGSTNQRDGGNDDDGSWDSDGAHGGEDEDAGQESDEDEDVGEKSDREDN